MPVGTRMATLQHLAVMPSSPRKPMPTSKQPIPRSSAYTQSFHHVFRLSLAIKGFLAPSSERQLASARHQHRPRSIIAHPRPSFLLHRTLYTTSRISHVANFAILRQLSATESLPFTLSLHRSGERATGADFLQLLCAAVFRDE